MRKLRLVMVTAQPAPYRNPVYERVARQEDIDLQVLYCARREPDRAWVFDRLPFPHRFLPEKMLSWRGRYIHMNPGTWSALREARPDVLMITGFNPTHLLTFAYARAHGIPLVAATDGTKAAEDAVLTPVHRAVRRIIYKRTEAFVGASEGAFALYRDYGVPDARMFKSHLCVDNEAFQAARQTERPIDLIYSARLIALKSPFFAIEVAAGIGRRLGRRVRLAILGNGVLEDEVRQAAAAVAADVEVEMPGFIEQNELPGWFGRSRVFLFPSKWDPWGVVANEATAAGVPTLVSPHAGAAHELIVDGLNGQVLELDREAWIEAGVRLLSDPAHWARMSAGCDQMAAEFNFDNSAEGIAEAVRQAAGRSLRGGNPRILPHSLRPAETLAS